MGRGGSFCDALVACGARIEAVCDTQEDRLEACAQQLGARSYYRDYPTMLAQAKLDAVIIGTPMQHHADQAIMALAQDLSVLSEVPAGVTLEECRRLVVAAECSGGTYMMAENYSYMLPNTLVRELVRQGLFGQLYYAEGEYLHELKALNEQTPWRRTYQTGREGITYGTHSLGPILQWLPGDRVVRVCCEGSGHHHRDPRGDPYSQDTAVMLAKTAAGALIKIRVDMLSDRPHAMTNYQLQGTDGVYESSRGGPSERHKLWLRALSDEARWHDLENLITTDTLAERFSLQNWRHPPAEAARAGHGGGDYFVVRDFVRACRGEAPPPVGIHEAMDMTLPGLISQASAVQGGAWLGVPDSRDWHAAAPQPQLRMRWPSPQAEPAVLLPSGYTLRTYQDDRAAYLELMHSAGFSDWTAARLEQVLATVLPEGLFVVEHSASHKVVATAMAQHHPVPGLPFAGEVGWVATHPQHRGLGLGKGVTAAATTRLLRAGYSSVYLLTDDQRTPAIAAYVRLGFVPDLYTDGMAARWKAISAKLSPTHAKSEGV